jgi:hypothetical protein
MWESTAACSLILLSRFFLSCPEIFERCIESGASVGIDLVALGAHINRNTLRIIKAVEGAGRSR